jgi:haloacetate dehalogenase
MMALEGLADFSCGLIQAGATHIFARWAGSGPPVLLLHGFPETHLMWRLVAPMLARDFFVVCADLRGYGSSHCPVSDARHEAYAKRAMAQDMVEVMASFGHTRFAVVGHDRGGRVAYRLALDHPQHCVSLAVLDVLPTGEAWDRADARFALGYWPWTLLAQDEPLPELALQRLASAIVDAALGGWGSPAEAFPAEVRVAYVRALQDPGHAHAICEEYRAAATRDREHDETDRRAGRKIASPLTVLWSTRGALGQWYVDDGGPIALWRPWAAQVSGRGLDAGHFFPEESPQETAQELIPALAASPW